MSEEFSAPGNDRHRLSRLSSITWENLISAIFGLKLADIKDLPGDERETVASIINDLLEWIRSDYKDGKLQCSDIEQENPTFQTSTIGLWLWDINIQKWIKDRGLLLSPDVQKFLFWIAFGQDYEPLVLDGDGVLNIKHYGSLKKWTWADATRILHWLNPDKVKEVSQTLRAAQADHDVLFSKGFLKLEQGDRVQRVRPLVVLGWAMEKQFYVPIELFHDAGETALQDPELKRLNDELKIREWEKFVRQKQEAPEPTPEISEEQKEEQTAKVEQATDKSEEKNVEFFVKSLIFKCENQVEIIIQSPGEMPIVCSPSVLGFRDAKTKQWLNFIRLLNSPDGMFTYGSNKGQAKSIWGKVEKKLMDFMGKKFDLSFPENFKLFLPVHGCAGKRKTLFKVSHVKGESGCNFNNLDREEILEKIRTLAINPDVDTADSLAKAGDRARELGITDDDIKKSLRTDDLLRSETHNLNTIDSLDQDRPDIAGKRINQELNSDSLED
jgi:hypothetical protein